MSRGTNGDELPVGSVFGGYEIVRLLGTGAFGAVYEALRLPLRKRTALKVLHREFLRHTEVVQRFLREAEIVAQMEHPNIVGVFDVGVHDDQPYIAMEFLDGQSLADRIKRGGPLPREEAVDLCLGVMAAVAAVHEKGIVHRDLKPDNVLVARLSTGGTQPKLLDFGIAKIREAERSLTLTNAVMGTPLYMSPEQAQESKHIDGQSDQWSLAVILFECLTGTNPFVGDSMLAVLTAITARPIPTLRGYAPGEPEALESALLRAMDRTPAARWPSVRAFGAAILPFASAGGRMQWTPFFGDASAASVSTSQVRVSHIPEAYGHTLSNAGPGVGETLEPATRSALGLGSRSSGRWKGPAAAALTACVVAVGGWVASHSGAASHPAQLAGEVRVTPIRPAAALAPTVPSEPVAPTVAAPAVPTAVVPAVVAPVVAPGAPAVEPVAASAVPDEAPVRTGRHGGRARPAAPARVVRPAGRPASRNCPNGICAFDE